ncbi:MAG: hypothetical protein K0U74_07220 [Alphaproteobacteria bacterium]|nr:hypothetical protein [Alphaproteobacteria bacterium]
MTDETNEVAQNAVQATDRGGSRGHIGSFMTAIASAVALLFSAISLYHSVLKQPELDVHMSQVVHYTRDANGNFEVFAIPITIANHGARDGTVLDLELTVRPASGDGEKVFYSAYTVDGDFFVPPGRYDMQARKRERVDRPKAPFAPIAVPGRGSYSGTLLFYTKGKAFPKVVTEKGDFKLRLTLNARLDESLGPLDAAMRKPLEPVELTVRLPYYSESTVLRGGTHTLKNVGWTREEGESADGVDAAK